LPSRAPSHTLIATREHVATEVMTGTGLLLWLDLRERAKGSCRSERVFSRSEPNQGGDVLCRARGSSSDPCRPCDHTPIHPAGERGAGREGAHSLVRAPLPLFHHVPPVPAQCVRLAAYRAAPALRSDTRVAPATRTVPDAPSVSFIHACVACTGAE
jgi:hypothetical protein